MGWLVRADEQTDDLPIVVFSLFHMLVQRVFSVDAEFYDRKHLVLRRGVQV